MRRWAHDVRVHRLPDDPPVRKHRDRRLIGITDSDHDIAAARKVGHESGVLLTRHRQTRREEQHRPTASLAADARRLEGMGLHASERAEHPGRQSGNRRRQTALRLEVRHRSPLERVCWIPRLYDNLAPIAGGSGQRLRARRVSPPEDNAADAVRPGRLWQPGNKRSEQRQPADEKTDGQCDAADNAAPAARTPRPPPPQNGSRPNCHCEHEPRHELPAQTLDRERDARQDKRGCRERLKNGGSALPRECPPKRGRQRDDDHEAV